MQKKLLTAAVAAALAAPVAAFADVTVYGSIDTGIRQQSKLLNATTGGTESKLTMDSQNKKSNRWGLTGSNDLGGGMKASFTLEGGYSSDTGSGPGVRSSTQAGGPDSGGLNFERKAIVGVSSGGWSVDMGHNYTLNHSTEGKYDPLSQDYGTFTVGLQGATKTVRVSNSVTANFRFGTGGVGVQYGLGERQGSSGDGARTGFNADFAFGPVTVAAAYGNTAGIGTAEDTKETQFGAKYTMGAFAFMGGYGVQDDGVDKTIQLMGGVNYSFSPTLLGRVAYYDAKDDVTDLKANTIVLAIENSLSKSTLVYGALSRTSMDAGVAGTTQGSPQDGTTQIGAGLQVVF